MMKYHNLRRKTDGTFIINYKGADFHVTPDYPAAETYGIEYTFEKLNEYAESHPNEVTTYIEPDAPQPSEDELRKVRIFGLESEAQKLMPSIQAGIDTDINQQKLVDIMLDIEDLKGNLE